MVKPYSRETLGLVEGLTDHDLYTPAEVADSGQLNTVLASSVRRNIGMKMRKRFRPIAKAYKSGFGPAYYGFQYKAEILGTPLVRPPFLKDELTEEALHDLRMYAHSRGIDINQAVQSLLESTR